MIPDMIPKYSIIITENTPFRTICEEMPGWFIVPREGEKTVWGLYDRNGKLLEYSEMSVVGKASVHEIAGIEINAITHDIEEERIHNHGFVLQLTDEYCRVIAHSTFKNDIHEFTTFLDGEAFNNWFYGEKGLGSKIHIEKRDDIEIQGDHIIAREIPFFSAVGERCTICIQNKQFDTIRVIECPLSDGGILTEQFIDPTGRTILWRRYNKANWNYSRYGKTWDQLLPGSEIIYVNGEAYYHWYDCITDYIFSLEDILEG